MSDHWAGYSGVGMVLTVPEFNKMLEAYKEKNPEQSKIVDEAADNGDMNETELIMSKFAGQIPDLQKDTKKYADKVMYIMEVLDDMIDGVTFWPFYRKDGKKNLSEQDEDGYWESPEGSHPIWDSNEDRCYFLFADRALDTVEAFEEKPYASYEAFVQEFKDKMEAYLPEDFDWNAHLGNLTYAAFG